jgi:hypothetical protein
VDEDLRPGLFQGLVPSGHAVQPEAAGHFTWQRDKTKHVRSYPPWLERIGSDDLPAVTLA